ncbi:uncharacterized protein LOC127103660 [Lathyrus oleraceus]|uniref:uncharacterized protein LOC127103660 n=1 Tax=Pisum sativum TaxID=3888 RepID=UPI0021CDF8CB|nr:uncharacterized protein LOC127103660 [Pisum sativum]
MDNVRPMFYERMVGSVSASFFDLVAVGIKVELGLKNGKMISAAGTSNNNNVKKFPENFQKKRKERQMMYRPIEGGVNHGESNNDSSLNNNQHTLCMRELVEKKILSFRDLWPNVKSNPLPAYGTVNTIEEASDGNVIKDVANINTPLLAFYARLVEAGLVSACHKDYEECAIHPRGCEMVRKYVQDLMNQGVLQFSILVRRDEVAVIEPFFNLPEPIEITYRRKDIVQPVNHLTPVVICMPSPFPYESTKAVPWKYDITVTDKESEESRQEKSLKVDGVDVTNITGISQMTRSGRIYTPQFDVTSQVPTKETTIAVLIREQNMVQSNEDAEFLKIIKKTCNTLSFNGGELPKQEQNHNCALHVSVKCQEDTLARVLVDTRSPLNALLKNTLAKLDFQGSEMSPNALIVKAFDGSRRTVIGEVELPILIGPCVFNITFQVMDINPAYSFLLGRPWIHADGEVTSTLHQKMNFVINNKLVIIYGEEDLMVSHLSSFRYIEADEDALETSFQALEIANATFVEVKESVEKVIL